MKERYFLSVQAVLHVANTAYTPELCVPTCRNMLALENVNSVFEPIAKC
jgi:hypothetical protein